MLRLKVRSTERLIVDAKVADAFVDKLAQKVASLRAADPQSGAAPLGSLIGAAAGQRIQALVDDALSKGARLLAGGDYEKVWAWLPGYVRTVEAEMGGRHLAMMLGALVEAGTRFEARVHAYGPSSGSGNYVISLLAAA